MPAVLVRRAPPTRRVTAVNAAASPRLTAAAQLVLAPNERSRMNAWLGIGILLAFSLALNSFMRLEFEPRPEPGPELRVWTRIESKDLPPDLYLERRVAQVHAER